MKQQELAALPEGEADLPLDVSEEECELTENEVDMLMDALDDDEDEAASTNQVDDLGPIEPLNSCNQEDGSEADNAPVIESKYSFSLPAEEDEDQEEEEEPSSEDAATESTSGSDEPRIAPSANIPQAKTRKRVKQDEEQAAKSAKPTGGKKDEWDEARAVSHLLLSPYDASFGLLSRVDTR